jgi:hypothetical protein
MRNILFGNVLREKPSEAQLKAWFEEHRNAYDSLPCMTLSNFAWRFKSRGARKRRRSNLCSNWEPVRTPKPMTQRCVAITKRPGANLLSVFGEEYGRRLIDSIDGAWVAVRSAQGWHLARVIRRYEGEPVDFDEVRTKVATDWQEASARLQLARAVREIADQYELRLEFEEPGAGGRAKHESAAQAAALQDSVAQR